LPVQIRPGSRRIRAVPFQVRLSSCQRHRSRPSMASAVFVLPARQAGIQEFIKNHWIPAVPAMTTWACACSVILLDCANLWPVRYLCTGQD
jgi:hypothetical protein